MATEVITDKDLIDIIENDADVADFSDNFVGDDSMKSILAQLRANEKRSLLLRGNSITSDGLSLLSEYIKTTSILENLSLEWNTVGSFEQGMRTLGEALEINRSLQSLDLRNNHISAEGGKSLATGLKMNTTLRFLDLRWNDINEGAVAFKELLLVNKTLETIQLTGNKIDETVLASINDLLSSRTKGSVTTIQDDLHIAREKAEILERRMKQRDYDAAHSRRQDLEKLRISQEESKEWEEKYRETQRLSELELNASAERVTRLEGELNDSRRRVHEWKEKYENERILKEKLALDYEKLDSKHSDLSKKSDLEVQKYESWINMTKQERNVIAENLENIRVSSTEKLEVAQRSLDEMQAKSDELERERMVLQSKVSQLETSNESLRTENKCCRDRNKEMEIKIQKDGEITKRQIDDIRKTYEDRIDNLKKDTDGTIQNLRQRCLKFEQDLCKLTMAKQADLAVISRLEIQMEEKLSEQECRISEENRAEVFNQLEELQERIKALQASREFHERESNNNLRSIAELKRKSAAELSMFSKEIKQIRSELEDARENGRKHDGIVSKLNNEIRSLQRKLESYERKIHENEREVQHMITKHSSEMEALQTSFDNNRQDYESQISAARALNEKLSSLYQKSSVDLAATYESSVQHINTLEKSLGKFIQDTFASTRKKWINTKFLVPSVDSE